MRKNAEPARATGKTRGSNEDKARGVDRTRGVDPVRRAALELLLRVEGGGYSNLLLDAFLADAGFSGQDAAFLTALFYGVLERGLCLDYFISQFGRCSAAGLEPKVHAALRLGAYQLLFMDRVPAPAAVDESVRLARACGAPYAAGFVNAVLRRVAENRENPPYPDRERDRRRFLRVRYSCPAWLLARWEADYGIAQAQRILQGFEQRPGTTLRVNTLKTTAQELSLRLEREGVAVRPGLLPNALEAPRLPGLRALPSFREGLFSVQGTGSQLCCAAAQARPGGTVLDLCAAPGGKSFTLAMEMQNRGRIAAFDLYESRAGLIREGAKRLGLSIVEAAQGDAARHNGELGEFDTVLCDVPCSGLGVIGRKPEIRLKQPEDFAALPETQFRILCEGASHVRPGGQLLYSTCTLAQAENETVARRFLTEHSEFSPELPAALRPFAQEGAAGVTLFPEAARGDGFYICAMRRADA